MKKTLFNISVLSILVWAQSCMTLLSKHEKIRFQLETNTPVKVYAYNYKSGNFDQVTQTSISSNNSTAYDVSFKKAKHNIPTPKKNKRLEKLKKGEELTVYNQSYSKSQKKSGQTTITGYSNVEKTKLKSDVMLKLVPEEANYSEMIYKFNGVENGGRVAGTWFLDMVGGAIILFPVFFPIDMINQTNIDFPKRITINLNSSAEQGQPLNNTPNAIAPVIQNTPLKKPENQITEYSFKTTGTLTKLKTDLVAAGNYDEADKVKKELTARENENNEIAELEKKMNSAINADDFGSAATFKKQIAEKKEIITKKDKLRADIEASTGNKEKILSLENELKSIN